LKEGVTARGAPLAAFARRCWQAVATLGELREAAPSPLAVTLLGERRTDRVSIQYRRWLRELVACESPDDLAQALLLPSRNARTDEHLKVT
jgi:hypothetical protein